MKAPRARPLRVVLTPGGERFAPGSVRLLHPGGCESFVGRHRRFEGGLLTDDDVLIVAPGLVDLAPMPAGQGGTAHDLWLALRTAVDRISVLSWANDQLDVVAQVHCSGLHLGGTMAVTWRGLSAQALQLPSGQPIALPLGAGENRAQPWPDAEGLSWLLGRSLVARCGAAPVSVLGVAGETLRRLQIGPQGAAIAWGTQQAWVHAPGQGLVACDTPLVDAPVSWAPDGSAALVETDDGVGCIDLATGALLDEREAGRPAGWKRWLDPSGRARAWSRHLESVHLPGPGVVMDGFLHGPGGLIWDLSDLTAVGRAATAGLDLATPWDDKLLTLEDGLVAVDGEPLHQLDDDEVALDLWTDRRLAAVRTDQGVVAGGLDPASWRARPLTPPALVLHPAAQRLGLPLDGSVVLPDGGVLAWQDDGPLLHLLPGATPVS